MKNKNLLTVLALGAFAFGLGLAQTTLAGSSDCYSCKSAYMKCTRTHEAAYCSQAYSECMLACNGGD